MAEPPGAGELSGAPGVAIAGAYGFIVLGLTDSVVGVAWPSIRQTFHQPLSALSLLLIAAALGYLLTAIPSGHILNRFGAPMTMVTASLAAGLACAIYAGSPLFAILPAASLLLGAASGSIDAGLNTVVANGQSVRMLNFVHGAYGVGTVLGPILVAAAIAALGSWRVPYLVLIAAEIICSGGWWAVRHAIDTSQPVRPQLPDRAVHESGEPGLWSGGFAERFLVAAVVVVPFIYTGTELSVGQWAASYLREQMHLRPAAAGLGVAAYWGAYAVVRLLMALPNTQLNARLVMPAGCVVALGGALAVWLVPTAAGSVVGFVIIGSGLAPVFPALISLTPLRLGQERARHVIGWQMAAAGAGGLGIAALTGVLLGRLGLLALGPILVLLLLLVTASNFLMDFLAGRHQAELQGPSAA
jgi:fucose permease